LGVTIKILLSLIFFAITFTLAFSCSDDDGGIETNYHDKVVNVNLTNKSWYTSINKYSDSLFFGHINLKISGSTDAHEIYIETFGDGEIG
jgi:hypothetical protein